VIPVAGISRLGSALSCAVKKLLLLLLTACTLLAAALVFQAGRKPAEAPFFLEATLTSSVSGQTQVYFGSGQGYNEHASARRALLATTAPTAISFPLAAGDYRTVRFDPIDRAGTVVVHALRLKDGEDRTLRTLDPTRFRVGQQIERVQPLAGTLEIVTVADASDPQLEITLEPPVVLRVTHWQRFRDSAAVPLVTAAFVGVLTFALLSSQAALLTRRARVLLCCAVFLLIWSARLTTIDRYGSDLPYWDQWDKEGLGTFAPWLERGDFWRNVFGPHNEHRVAPTVALNLTLMVIGGTWDGRVQCVVNAALLAGVAALAVFHFSRRFSAPWSTVFALLIAAFAGLPLAWENITVGFQSQFTFLMLFSGLATAGLLAARPFSARWWLALLAAAIALVSMGSGFVWAAPVAGLLLLRWAKREASLSQVLPTLAAAAGFIALGLWLRTSVPGHQALHARSVLEFLEYAGRCLAWPFPDAAWLAMPLWLPWLAIVIRRLRSTSSTTPRATEDLLLAGGAWVVLQAAAVAYARGASGGMLPSRYGEVFGLGPVLNVACLAVLAQNHRAALRASALFVGLVGVGAVLLAGQSWHRHLPARAQECAQFVLNVRDFLVHDDFATFARRPLPFPDAKFLAEALRRPALRRILPSSVQPPLIVEHLVAPAPPAPPFWHPATRTIAQSSAEWRSAELPSSSGWWRIETAGAISPRGELTLVAANNNRRLATVVASRPPGNSWRAAYVPAPREPAQLIAQVPPAKGGTEAWLAFSAPFPVSTLSYRTWQLTQQGPLLLALSVALLGCALAAGCWGALRRAKE
jgi:hypothetical protein